jgi:hypothetical protein
MNMTPLTRSDPRIYIIALLLAAVHVEKSLALLQLTLLVLVWDSLRLPSLH